MVQGWAGTLGAGTEGATGTLTCSLAAVWWRCWWMTRVVNTPSMATALATSKSLFDCPTATTTIRTNSTPNEVIMITVSRSSAEATQPVRTRWSATARSRSLPEPGDIIRRTNVPPINVHSVLTVHFATA
jgi:hypothetical protein